MKTKTCYICDKEYSVMFRVQLRKGKIWVFVCEDCCRKVQELPEYTYGGTWKGSKNSKKR